jgi:general secretion pathway protein E
VTRLADMGVEPYLLASSLLGVLAQRLVRTLCPACRVAHAPSAGENKLNVALGLPPDQPVWTTPGCDACNHTGHRGRTGVYELLPVDDAIRRDIHDGAGELVLREAALRGGMRSLRADGARWIAEGRTSLAELLRVTRDA